MTSLEQLSAKPSRKLSQQTKLFCFDIDNGQKNIFFRNKTFLFFKIESWNFFGRCQYQNKKALFTDSIFREGFGLYNILYYPGWRKHGGQGDHVLKFFADIENITEAKLDSQLADFWTFRHLCSSTVLLSSFQQLSSSSSCCMMVPLLTVTMAFNVQNNLKIVMTHVRVLLL